MCGFFFLTVDSGILYFLKIFSSEITDSSVHKFINYYLLYFSNQLVVIIKVIEINVFYLRLNWFLNTNLIIYKFNFIIFENQITN